MPTRVMLWTAPRTVSTAFERAFMQRPSTRIFHEPYGGPYYFGPERASRRYLARPADPTQTFAAVTASLVADSPGDNLTFAKDMAYYVDGRLDLAALTGFQHTFLIREPRKAIASLHRMAVRADLDGWGWFDPAEAGFHQLAALFDQATRLLGRPPVVIDAADLLAHPEAMLAAYCAAVGVAFDPAMLRWEPGAVREWATWAPWHAEVAESQGFRAERRADEPLADEVLAAVADCDAPYRRLHAHRLIS
jgi:hypothetical protein